VRRTNGNEDGMSSPFFWIFFLFFCSRPDSQSHKFLDGLVNHQTNRTTTRDEQNQAEKKEKNKTEGRKS
jgi:hypothetical protein